MIVPDENSISGYLTDIGYEPVSDSFTDCELLTESGHCILLRAKRYGRWWMLKGLKPSLARHNTYRRMLRKEFDTIIRMQHPGIVNATEMVELTGPYAGCYIAMEWIDGPSLDQWLRQPRSRAEKLRVISQLTAAVTYIHSQGIVHRDLKPRNILITANGGYLKIIDFGLADAEFFSILKHPAGTKGYISPEQQTQATPDVRNDIYSLGCILRSMQLGPRYRHIITRCLGPIDRRYPDAAQLQQAIDSAPRRTLLAIAATLLLLTATLLTTLSLIPSSVSSHPVVGSRPVATATSANNTATSAATSATNTATNTVTSATHPSLPSGEASRASGPSTPIPASTITPPAPADTLISRGIMAFEREAAIIDHRIDTLTSRTHLTGYSLPDKAWRNFYHNECGRHNLSDTDLDRIYSTLQRHSLQRYATWNKRLKNIHNATTTGE